MCAKIHSWDQALFSLILLWKNGVLWISTKRERRRKKEWERDVSHAMSVINQKKKIKKDFFHFLLLRHISLGNITLCARRCVSFVVEYANVLARGLYVWPWLNNALFQTRLSPFFFASSDLSTKGKRKQSSWPLPLFTSSEKIALGCCFFVLFPLLMIDVGGSVTKCRGCYKNRLLSILFLLLRGL